MKHSETHAHSLQEPEVVMNLWAYADEAGNILRLAGRAYALEGDDEDKLAILRALAKTDFLATPWHKVPANFKMNGPDGKVMRGIAHVSMLSVESSHAELFRPLMDELESTLPDQLRCVGGDYAVFKLNLPDAPLAVTTVVMEYDDGRLVPMVSGR